MVTAGSAIYNSQIALILLTFLTCYVIIKMKQRKENLEEDNVDLKDKYSEVLYERDRYKHKYETTKREIEDLKQGAKDTKKRGLFKPFIDIFKILRNKND